MRCLPFPKQRDAHGRLFAALPNRVPPVMAPSKPLWFPLRLGSLDVDLELQDVRLQSLWASLLVCLGICF